MDRGGGADLLGQATLGSPNACAQLELTTVLLGPVEVRREAGKPRQEELPFESPAHGSACLVVVNGAHDPPHGGRVSAAWLALDGQALLGPAAFSQQVARLEREVALEPGAHQLGVELASAPGSFLTLTVHFLGRDEEPPALVIEPADGTEVATDQPRLRVGYSDAGSGVEVSSLAVRLNGEEVTGHFAIGPDEAIWQVPLEAYLWEGPNELQARVADRAGNLAQGSSSFQVRTPTDQLLAALESEEPLERRRAAAKLVYREAEVSTEVLQRSLQQLHETPEPRAVDGLLGLARPDRGELGVRLLTVAVLGETARKDAITAGRPDVVAGLGALLHEDRAPGVKALSARALGLTQNPAALGPLDEFLEAGPRVPAAPPSCEFLDEQRCYEHAAYLLLAGFPVIKAAIRIAGHGHVVGNPGDILEIWRRYRRDADALLGSGTPGGAP